MKAVGIRGQGLENSVAVHILVTGDYFADAVGESK